MCRGYGDSVQVVHTHSGTYRVIPTRKLAPHKLHRSHAREHQVHESVLYTFEPHCAVCRDVLRGTTVPGSAPPPDSLKVPSSIVLPCQGLSSVHMFKPACDDAVSGPSVGYVGVALNFLVVTSYIND